MVLIAKSKWNSIEVLISRPLTNSIIINQLLVLVMMNLFQ